MTSKTKRLTALARRVRGREAFFGTDIMRATFSLKRSKICMSVQRAVRYDRNAWSCVYGFEGPTDLISRLTDGGSSRPLAGFRFC